MFVLPFFWNSFNLATEEKWKGWVRETVLWRVSPRGLMQSPQLGNFKMLAEQRRSLEERENTFIFAVKTVSSVTVSLFVFSDRIWQIVNQNNQKQNNQKQEPKEVWLTVYHPLQIGRPPPFSPTGKITKFSLFLQRASIRKSAKDGQCLSLLGILETVWPLFCLQALAENLEYSLSIFQRLTEYLNVIRCLLFIFAILNIENW